MTDRTTTDHTMPDDGVVDDSIADDPTRDDRMADGTVADRTTTDDPATGHTMPDTTVADEVRTPPPASDDPMAPPDTGVEAGMLFADSRDDWSGRWDDIQIGFVDEPRDSIEQADALVDEVIEQLTTRLAGERQRLEDQWSAGSEPSTEDLRVALQHYRAFFERLLAA